VKQQQYDDDYDDDGDSKIIPIQAWTSHEGFRSWRLPEILDSGT